MMERSQKINFGYVNFNARLNFRILAERLLPDGRLEGHEWVARNPTRVDRNPGSFKINLHTGMWADFATGDKGGDPVSLVAFLFGISQTKAANKLADMMGIGNDRYC